MADGDRQAGRLWMMLLLFCTNRSRKEKSILIYDTVNLYVCVCAGKRGYYYSSLSINCVA
jgi:hypothetical protein